MAHKYLRETQIVFERPLTDITQRFERELSVFLSFFADWIRRKIVTNGIWKLLIEVNFSDRRSNGKIIGGVWFHSCSFNYGKLAQQEGKIRNAGLLSFFTEAVIEAMRAAQLDCSIMNGFQEYVIEQDYTFSFCGKRVKHEGLSSEVLCIQRTDKTDVFLRILKGRQIQNEIFIKSISTSIFELNCYLVKDPVWRSSNLVEIPVLLDDISKIQVDLESGKSTEL